MLKPCPFCGETAEMKVNPTTLNAQAYCKNCGVVMKRNYKGSRKIEDLLQKLIEESWNQRVKEE